MLPPHPPSPTAHHPPGRQQLHSGVGRRVDAQPARGLCRVHQQQGRGGGACGRARRAAQQPAAAGRLHRHGQAVPAEAAAVPNDGLCAPGGRAWPGLGALGRCRRLPGKCLGAGQSGGGRAGAAAAVVARGTVRWELRGGVAKHVASRRPARTCARVQGGCHCGVSLRAHVRTRAGGCHCGGADGAWAHPPRAPPAPAAAEGGGGGVVQASAPAAAEGGRGGGVQAGVQAVHGKARGRFSSQACCCRAVGQPGCPGCCGRGTRSPGFARLPCRSKLSEEYEQLVSIEGGSAILPLAPTRASHHHHGSFDPASLAARHHHGKSNLSRSSIGDGHIDLGAPPKPAGAAGACVRARVRLQRARSQLVPPFPHCAACVPVPAHPTVPPPHSPSPHHHPYHHAAGAASALGGVAQGLTASMSALAGYAGGGGAGGGSQVSTSAAGGGAEAHGKARRPPIAPGALQSLVSPKACKPEVRGGGGAGGRGHVRAVRGLVPRVCWSGRWMAGCARLGQQQVLRACCTRACAHAGAHRALQAPQLLAGRDPLQGARACGCRGTAHSALCARSCSRVQSTVCHTSYGLAQCAPTLAFPAHP